MKTLVAKTRVKNLTNQPRLLRWLQYGGTYLQPKEEIIVDGLYPSACEKQQLRAQATYDIERELVEIEIITTMACRQPKEGEFKPSRPQPGVQVFAEKPAAPAEKKAPAAKAEKPAEAPKAEKVDERWHKGGIDSMKPEPVTLPGHEETLKQTEPETLAIFGSGPQIESDKGDVVLATELGKPAEAPKAEPAPAEAVAVTQEAPAATAVAEPPAEPAATDQKPKGRKRAAI